MTNTTKYYWIDHLHVLGKAEKYRYYVFRNGTWVPDEAFLIQDRLIGFDPYEDADSPYRTGNTEIMDEIEEICEERAERLMAEHFPFRKQQEDRT